MSAARPGRLYEVAARQRAALLRGERRAASELVRAYGGVWQRIQGRVTTLLEQRAVAERAGETVGDSWLYQFNRIDILQRQVEAELRTFAEIADPLITRQQATAVDTALAHSEDLVRTATQQASVSVGWSRLPASAIEDLIGFTANGSPLRELLDALGPAASTSVRDALIQGLALGHNPTRIAREIRGALGGNVARALTISRTETLRAYREATRRSYEANSDVVDGWIWNCACTERSCATCWAEHGAFHLNGETLASHPNCRCAMLPVTKPFPGMSPQKLPESGPAQFGRLTTEQQDAILGKAAGRAYRDGAFKLEDVVARTFDPDWGPGRRVRSLRELVGAEEAVKWQKSGSQRADLPAKPAGKKISEVLDMTKMPGPKATLRQSVDRALAAIESVHGVPDRAPSIPLQPVNTTKSLGRYRYNLDGKPVAIHVSQKGSRPELTFAHEVGHYLDHQVLDQAGAFASETSDKLEAWRKVVRESEAVKSLQAALDTGKVLYPNGSIGPSDRGWLRRALSHEELFARSYAQYIAEVAQDETMLKSIAELRQQSYLGIQWSREDFAQIRGAFDELLDVLGWRK